MSRRGPASPARGGVCGWRSPFQQGALLVVVLLLGSGCATTAGQWLPEASDTPHAAQDMAALRSEDFETAFAQARSQHAWANDADSLTEAIRMLEALLQRYPDNRDVQVELAEALVLYGAAYASGRAAKRARFVAAQQHAERALMANTSFRTALAAGQRPGLAATELDKDDVPAMVIWATATAYLFDEGMTAVGRLRSFRGLEDLRLFMEQALRLAPEHEYGLVPFSLAIFHIAAPPIAGGNRQFAAELIEQAISTPGVSLLPRWGRARYLYPLTRDREQLVADLEWVLAQDPQAVNSPYRWNVFVQRDAQRMLERL